MENQNQDPVYRKLRLAAKHLPRRWSRIVGDQLPGS